LKRDGKVIHNELCTIEHGANKVVLAGFINLKYEFIVYLQQHLASLKCRVCFPCFINLEHSQLHDVCRRSVRKEKEEEPSPGWQTTSGRKA
jgi:hypothetical protein